MARIVPAPRRSTIATNRRIQRGPLTADGTFGLGDDIVLWDTTAADYAGFLPSAAAVPQGTVYVGAITAGANKVTLTADGTDTIEGAATSDITATIHAVGVQSDGISNWTRVEAGFWA